MPTASGGCPCAASSETIGLRLVRDLAAMFRTCRPHRSRACDQSHRSGQPPKRWFVYKDQRLLRYPSPTATATSGSGGYVDAVVIGCGGEIIARHPRCYDREDMVFDPVHYLPLIERKIKRLGTRLAPLAEWDLPRRSSRPCADLMEARMIKAGRPGVCSGFLPPRLLETFDIDDLHAA